jgi:hypothetical protein
MRIKRRASRCPGEPGRLGTPDEPVFGRKKTGLRPGSLFVPYWRASKPLLRRVGSY